MQRVRAGDVPFHVRNVLDAFVAHRSLHGMCIHLRDFDTLDETDEDDEDYEMAVGDLTGDLINAFDLNPIPTDTEEELEFRGTEFDLDDNKIPGTTVGIWDAAVALHGHLRLLNAWEDSHFSTADGERLAHARLMMHDHGWHDLESTEMMPTDPSEPVLFEEAIGKVGDETGWDVPLPAGVELPPDQAAVRRYVLWAVAAMKAVRGVRSYFRSHPFYASPCEAISNNVVKDARLVVPPRLVIHLVERDADNYA